MPASRHLDAAINDDIHAGDTVMRTSSQYDEEDSVGAAREWLEQSKKGPGKPAAVFWDGVADKCADRYGITLNRNSRRSFW